MRLVMEERRPDSRGSEVGQKGIDGTGMTTMGQLRHLHYGLEAFVRPVPGTANQHSRQSSLFLTTGH